jgi:hypothetical protein
LANKEFDLLLFSYLIEARIKKGIGKNLEWEKIREDDF